MDYNVIINRKKIKNVYIRVDDNGNVVVNANKRVKDKYIYDLLNEKDDWIQKRLKAINNKSEVYDINGRKISVFGRKYIIKVIKDKKNKIELKENYFFLYTKYDDMESMVKLINKYLKELFLDNLNCYIIKEC
ncbi:YgjP-like metallopeptidase domain-containing protein, partial [Anaerofustis stercorihominis]|uniref:YgjP-like metallopeptidase domain-containing protein n=1 Tax=Anaerofustis stercorihominis TaxID=214853 RepID=UPI001485134D